MLKHKKLLTATMIFIVATFVVIGCSESDKSIDPISQTKHSFVGEDGKTYTYDTADPDFIEAKKQSEVLENWIERMDPYVTENKDGTYDFDHTSFEATYGELDGINKSIVKQLKEGIPIVNQKIQEKGRTGAPSAAGLYMQWHWWGITYCYTGYTAYLATAMITATGKLPYVGWLIGISYGSWAAYLTATYGGFCSNQTWNGIVWLSAP